MLFNGKPGEDLELKCNVKGLRLRCSGFQYSILNTKSLWRLIP